MLLNVIDHIQLGLMTQHLLPRIIFTLLTLFTIDVVQRLSRRMDISVVSNEPGSRSYRLRNRRRPCDQCRSRKVRCQAEGDNPPCRRCEQTHTACTFQGGRPSRATRQDRRLSSSPATPSPSADRGHQTQISADSHNDTAPVSNAGDVIATGSPGFLHHSDLAYQSTSVFDGRIPSAQLQFSHTLDGGNDQTCILLGTSSESDPWLLRHCQFDEYGLRSFYGLQFRNIGGVPNRQKIPVHFILTPKHKDQAQCIGRETPLRERLNTLIPVSWGIRLIKL